MTVLRFIFLSECNWFIINLSYKGRHSYPRRYKDVVDWKIYIFMYVITIISWKTIMQWWKYWIYSKNYYQWVSNLGYVQFFHLFTKNREREGGRKHIGSSPGSVNRILSQWFRRAKTFKSCASNDKQLQMNSSFKCTYIRVCQFLAPDHKSNIEKMSPSFYNDWIETWTKNFKDWNHIH